ncbi:hypothetical protein EVAR_101305_1 [Eumeta japonica]|uniref:Uncharacterized protein n=1 Tax=Eumeta variegata TaxID=151549 RepID=A0A4C2ABY0_EUMVA|nr:hypothetical protein EVAR_101305_1 [Eumeta japonica]
MNKSHAVSVFACTGENRDNGFQTREAEAAAAGGPSVYLSTHANWPELRMSSLGGASAAGVLFNRRCRFSALQMYRPVFTSNAGTIRSIFINVIKHEGSLSIYPFHRL